MTYRSDSSSPFSRILGPLRARQCACHSAQCQRLHQRVTEDLSRRHFLGGMAYAGALRPALGGDGGGDRAGR